MTNIGKYTIFDEKTRIFSSIWPRPPLPQQSIYSYLLGDVSFDDQTVAFSEIKSGKSIQYGQLKLKAQQFGLGLVKNCKLQPGDTVMLLCHSSIDFVTSLMAAQFVGLKVVLANPEYLSAELSHVVKLTKPKWVITTSVHLDRAIGAHIPGYTVILTDTAFGRAGLLFADHMLVDKETAKSAKAFVPSDLNTTAYLPLSSGTTGLPKAVEVTHANVVGMVQTLVHVPGFIDKEQMRTLSILPFFHVFALLSHVHLPLKIRGYVAIMRPFTPDAFCQRLREDKINMIQTVPPILTLLSKHPAATKESFSSVRFLSCGAAPLDAETQGRFTDKTGVRVTQGWGMTETTVGALGMNPVISQGSVGWLMPGVQAMIVDPDTDEPLGPDARGELRIRGVQVCKGYFNNQAATTESRTSDGFLKTGDVAIVTSETGEFWVVDRLKELIKYKGWQVPPAELEGVLVSHPKVAAAAVIGIQKEGTEVPLAFVQLEEGVEKGDQVKEEVDAFVRSKVSPHKYLRGGIRFINKVPVNPSGKVLRKEIRKLVQSESAKL